MQLEIDDQERKLLVQLLEQSIGEMKAEVRRSETREYHDQLKKDEHVLIALLGRLKDG